MTQYDNFSLLIMGCILNKRLYYKTILNFILYFNILISHVLIYYDVIRVVYHRCIKLSQQERNHDYNSLK